MTNETASDCLPATADGSNIFGEPSLLMEMDMHKYLSPFHEQTAIQLNNNKTFLNRLVNHFRESLYKKWTRNVQ